MMYGLRHDLREVREALFRGYERNDDDPSLAGALAKTAGAGVLAGLTAVSSRKFFENPNSRSGLGAATLGIATTYATGLAVDGIHDLAQSIRRGQADIVPERYES